MRIVTGGGKHTYTIVYSWKYISKMLGTRNTSRFLKYEYLLLFALFHVTIFVFISVLFFLEREHTRRGGERGKERDLKQAPHLVSWSGA